MKTIQKTPPHMLMWVAGIAVILFCGTGIAAMMGWLPSSIGQPAEPPLDKGSVSAHNKPHNSSSASNSVTSSRCANCGVIESTRVVSAKGDGGAVGIVGGAVVGGLLGNQVGGGRGKDLATVAGAVGGAYAGNEIEKHVNSSKSYETTVLLEDGKRRVFNNATPTQWQAGDRVKIIDGAIHMRS
jgi:outer membrane lipoprotein SlyB